jgi:hypothetical protein
VTNSRDTQELLPDAGHEMLRIFHTHPARTSLLQDFSYYEVRHMTPRPRSVTHVRFIAVAIGPQDADGLASAPAGTSAHAISAAGPPAADVADDAAAAPLCNDEPGCARVRRTATAAAASSAADVARHGRHEPDDAPNGADGRTRHAVRHAEHHARSQSGPGPGESAVHGHAGPLLSDTTEAGPPQAILDYLQSTWQANERTWTTASSPVT